MLKTHKTRLSILLFLLHPAFLRGADLKSETLRNWDAYVHHAQLRMRDRSRGQVPFLWLDETPDLSARVRAGEIIVEPEDGKSPHPIQRGLIHDWVGVMFVPNAKLDDVVGVLNSYGRYEDYYRPMVVKSRLLEEGPNGELVRLLMIQKAYSVTAAAEVDDEVHFVRLNGNRAYSLSTSIRVQEIADYGKPSAHAFPQDHGPGYIWRTFTVVRLEERDGGTYAEMEMIALSRGIPWAFRWLVRPLTEHLPQSVLDKMLIDTRAAVVNELRVAPCNTASLASSSDHR